MKTHKVIELLMKADPTGECECVINSGEAIHSIRKENENNSSGAFEIIRRDPVHNNIVSGKITISGDKVCIYPFSIEDAIYEFASNGLEFPVEVDIDDEVIKQRFIDRIEHWRAEAEDIEEVLKK